MVTIGWLEDNIGYTGGAEMSGAALRNNAPSWARIVHCPSNKRPQTEQIDCFVIQNCVTYSARWVEELALKPVIKQIRDPWYAGSALLRRWLLQNSALLLFSSQPQVDAFQYASDLPYRIIPPPLDLAPFREAALPQQDRRGSIFIGRVDIFKGAPAAIDWAIRNDEPLTLVGARNLGGGGLNFGKLPDFIRFTGQVPHRQIPYLLGSAKHFVFFPTWPEAFGRVVAEAWAAGCRLVLEGRIGAEWWLKYRKDEIENGVNMFWDAIADTLGVTNG